MVEIVVSMLFYVSIGSGVSGAHARVDRSGRGRREGVMQHEANSDRELCSDVDLNPGAAP